jgi:N-acetylmuramoyl-L-alanine amidase CwlD
LSWTNRLPVRAGSALLALIIAAALLPARAGAESVPDFWFAGTRLIFDRPQLRGADVAVGTSDAGLARFLARVGATLQYAPGQRYIVVTTSDRRTITLTVGDTRIWAGGITTAAPFAPYVQGTDAFLPFASLARALYVVPVPADAMTVLQPQFGALDVRSDDRMVAVTLHGATALAFRRSSASPQRLSLTFTGIGSSLDQTRAIASPALGQIDVVTSGSARNPATVVTFETPPGAQRVILPSSSSNELTLAFAPAGTALRGAEIPAAGSAATFATGAAPLPVQARVVPPPPVPAQMESQPAPPAVAPGGAAPASPAPAVVSGVDVVRVGDGAAEVRVAVSGGADFEWHRLGDGRWYVDLHGATLALPPRDDALSVGGIDGLRVRQFALDPVPIVRVSLTLASQRHVDIAPTATGLTVTVGSGDDLVASRIGVGRVGGGTSYASDQAAPAPEATPWKFSGGGPMPPAAANPRLIVLDPGHGGSDVGAQHNGVTEKDVTLDIALRLRSVLIARGWTVRMTRDNDRDVYAPNDSAHDELQARCDVANNAGARLFVSIHANSFTSTALSGTTTYYYKGVDLALAQAVHRHLIGDLGTRDDGVRKENFYVIHHTAMPAILVETAFISNPSDAALMRSPEFLQRVATAIANGVADYAKLPQSAAQSPSDDQN